MRTIHRVRIAYICRPLREVVSWNVTNFGFQASPVESTSSWGRELKYPLLFLKGNFCGRPLREVVSWNLIAKVFLAITLVDLFVRSWVEIIPRPSTLGKNTCRPLREVVSWNNLSTMLTEDDHLSTSSWGRELKYGWRRRDGRKRCRPLREVVSWNDMLDEKRQRYLVDLFARSWVEIMLSTVWKSRIRSTSSWGRELKYRQLAVLTDRISRPPCEVVSWNNSRPARLGQ